jgi:protein phosphatase
MHLRAGVATHVGLVRQLNEDSYLVRPGLYAVCDGMGGARAGEIASEMACRGLADVDPLNADAAALLARVREVNRLIADRSMRESKLQGMGTTATVAMAAGEAALVLVHVGDSRAYLLHEGVLRQLTDDHSWVGEMIRRGELTPAEAAVHPHRSVITKVLGTEFEVEPDVAEIPVAPGDRLLLCSDGLSGMLPDAAIEDIMRTQEGPQSVAESLVHAAVAAGGEDNVTVIVVDVVAAPADGDLSEGVSQEVLLGPIGRGGPGAEHGASGAIRGVRGRLAGWSALAGQRGAEPADEAKPTSASAGSVSARPDGPVTGSPSDLPSELPAVAVGAGAQLGMTVRSRSRRRRLMVVVLVAVLVLAVAIGGFAVFNSAVYYVGTHEGKVALYNGLPASILGMELSSVVELGTAVYDTLPSYVQERIDAHELTSKEEGQKYLRSLNAWQ